MSSSDRENREDFSSELRSELTEKQRTALAFNTCHSDIGNWRAVCGNEFGDLIRRGLVEAKGLSQGPDPVMLYGLVADVNPQ